MSFFRCFADSEADLQTPADVAVVIPSILRPTLGEALDSIFEQSFGGRIQVLVGIDKPVGDIGMVDALCARRPANVTVQLFYPGYSTSVRHGGVHPARDGGVLRCLLSYLANSRLVAYLDDDNWWDHDHLRQMCRAMERAAWAYAFRWFVHPRSRRPICVDDWESVGPDGGVFKRQGGWVDPNCLMIDKLACESVIRYWDVPLAGDVTQLTSDRNVFASLRAGFAGASTGRPSVYYVMGLTDGLHPSRLQRMGGLYRLAGSPIPGEERFIPAIFGPYGLTQRQI